MAARQRTRPFRKPLSDYEALQLDATRNVNPIIPRSHCKRKGKGERKWVRAIAILLRLNLHSTSVALYAEIAPHKETRANL